MSEQEILYNSYVKNTFTCVLEENEVKVLHINQIAFEQVLEKIKQFKREKQQFVPCMQKHLHTQEFPSKYKD